MTKSSKGMVEVRGTTYRIVESTAFHEVVRVLDDRCVGIFRHEPVLEVLESEIAPEALLEIAKRARRSGRLSWNPGHRPPESGAWLEGLRAGFRSARVLLASAFGG